jgi:hypothetical protein
MLVSKILVIVVFHWVLKAQRVRIFPGVTGFFGESGNSSDIPDFQASNFFLHLTSTPLV